ncbi:low-density lipoprotein receptor-like [Bolinopsis microptera]|uniref:low-density lipoprotein receptor-like n=1 Tax=Bolinopsis microptera TaxID=2820187 RepID=UPI00307A7D41
MVLKGTMLACIILLCLQGVLFADCPAGSFMSADGCQQCGLDQYSAAGATSCTPCPEGQLSVKGATSIKECYGEDDETSHRVIVYKEELGTTIEIVTKKGFVTDKEDPTDFKPITIHKGFVCPEGETKCGDVDECVPNSGLCNGAAACSNGFDESPELCASYQCPAEYEKCADGLQCFQSAGKCDKYKVSHCNDKSDDMGCDCKLNEMMCADGNGCALVLKKCDGQAQCADGSDESDDICYDLGVCSKGTKLCTSGNQCISIATMCDGTVNCDDGSDEDSDFCTEYECPPYQRKCDGNKCLPQWNLCDSEPDCEDESDEDPAFCAAYECPAAKKKCADGIQCVPKKLFCNGKAECTDGSDESEEECAEKKGGGKNVIEKGKGTRIPKREKEERVIKLTKEEKRRKLEQQEKEDKVPEPEPVVPVEPEPVVPVDPEPVVPVEPEPVVIVDPVPTATSYFTEYATTSSWITLGGPGKYGKKSCDCWTKECGFCTNPDCINTFKGGLDGSTGIGVRSLVHKRKVKTIFLYKSDGATCGQFQWSLNRISLSGCISCHTPQRIRDKIKELGNGAIDWNFAINDGVVELSVEGEILYTSKLTRQCAKAYGDVKSFSFTGMNCKSMFVWVIDGMDLSSVCGGADKCGADVAR